MIVQAISIIFVALRFYSELEIIKFRHNRVDENVGLGTVGLLVPMVVEMVFHIIINPPMNSEFGIEVIQIGREVVYTLDACVSFVCILRLAWYVVRNMQHYSMWMSERADRVSGANGYSANTLFAVKMHLNLDPVKVLIFTFGLSLFVFSVLYYIAEVG